MWWLPARGRVCSLAAGILTCACSGRVSTHVPSGGAGDTSSGVSGASSDGSGGSGSSTGGSSVGSGGSLAGSGGFAGSGGGVAYGGSAGIGGSPFGGSAGEAGSADCPFDCSNAGYCETCSVGRSATTCVVSQSSGYGAGQVMLDCSPLSYGDNGYTVNDLGQIELTGEACDALLTDAPHRIDVVLGCPLDR